MEMTDFEIRQSYRLAKNPQQQIRVLAELNTCSIAVIKRVLGLENEMSRMKTEIDPSTLEKARTLLSEGKTVYAVSKETGLGYNVAERVKREMDAENNGFEDAAVERVHRAAVRHEFPPMTEPELFGGPDHPPVAEPAVVEELPEMPSAASPWNAHICATMPHAFAIGKDAAGEPAILIQGGGVRGVRFCAWCGADLHGKQ